MSCVHVQFILILKLLIVTVYVFGSITFFSWVTRLDETKNMPYKGANYALWLLVYIESA